MIIRAILIVVGVVLLTSCGPTGNKFSRAETAAQAQKKLVGRLRSDVLLCMGPPLNQSAVGDVEVWTYARSGDQIAGIVGAGTNYPLIVSQARNCQADIAFRNGTVERVTYRGRTGGLITAGEQCAFLVAACAN